MTISDRFTNFLSLGLQNKCEETVLHKILLVNTLGIIAIIVLILFSAINYFEGNYLIGGLNLIISAFLILNFLYVYKKYNYSFSAQFLIGVISFYFLFQLLIGKDNVLFWYSIIPIICIMTLGLKKGTYTSLFFLFAAAIILFFPSENLTTANLSLALKIRFIGSYIAILFITYTFEYYKLLSIRNLERSLIVEKNENKSKEEFIARLSHQIRTPLNNIMLIGGMVNKENLTDEQEDLFDTIFASASNLSNVVDSITRISDLDSRARSSIRVSFNLYSTISNTLKLFSGEKSSLVHFNLDYDSSIPKDLIGDPILLKQIFLNLIETIVKRKLSESIAVKIVVKEIKTVSTKLEVQFDLLTSKPVNLPFTEKSYRFNSPRELAFSENADFTNLIELIIAKNIIEQNQSKLILKTTPNNTLIISFTLTFFKSIPEANQVADHGQVQDLIYSEPPRRIIQSSTALKDSNVLFAEDNLINQKLIMLSLLKFVKNIDVAKNGKEALEKFGTSKYDIILLDIQMPVMDGFVLTKKIREVEYSTGTHTPIIAITANALQGDRDVCLASGMDDYISKPFQMELLIEKMEALLAKK